MRLNNKNNQFKLIIFLFNKIYLKLFLIYKKI